MRAKHRDQSEAVIRFKHSKVYFTGTGKDPECYSFTGTISADGQILTGVIDDRARIAL